MSVGNFKTSSCLLKDDPARLTKLLEDIFRQGFFMVTSGQIGSARELYHWTGIEKYSN
jgi:hypothetical protein